jgi:hypothetical protein
MIGYTLTCETATYFVYESDDGTHELLIKKHALYPFGIVGA